MYDFTWLVIPDRELLILGPLILHNERLCSYMMPTAIQYMS